MTSFMDLTYRSLVNIHQFVPLLAGVNRTLRKFTETNLTHRISALSKALDATHTDVAPIYARACSMQRESNLFRFNRRYHAICGKIERAFNPILTLNFASPSPERLVTQVYDILAHDPRLSYMAAGGLSMDVWGTCGRKGGITIEFIRSDPSAEFVGGDGGVRVAEVPDFRCYVLGIRDGTISKDFHTRIFETVFLNSKISVASIRGPVLTLGTSSYVF